MLPPITSFKGQYGWMSNYYKYIIEYKGISYTSVEHFFQAWKTTGKQHIYIATCIRPKREGRAVELRKNWELNKDNVMEVALKLKFGNLWLWNKLRDTLDRELIEGNFWHDNYWGDCYCHKCKSIYGNNKLGKLLMKIREGGLMSVVFTCWRNDGIVSVFIKGKEYSYIVDPACIPEWQKRALRAPGKVFNEIKKYGTLIRR